jgi:hypothetical protein
MSNSYIDINLLQVSEGGGQAVSEPLQILGSYHGPLILIIQSNGDNPACLIVDGDAYVFFTRDNNIIARYAVAGPLLTFPASFSVLDVIKQDEIISGNRAYRVGLELVKNGSKQIRLLNARLVAIPIQINSNI